MLSLLAFNGISMINYPLSAKIQKFASGTGPEPSPSDFDLFFRSIVALEITFWVTLYCVKTSFLLLYYVIFRVSRPFKIAWLAVLAYTILSFLACILVSFWTCGSPSELFNLS